MNTITQNLTCYNTLPTDYSSKIWVTNKQNNRLATDVLRIIAPNALATETNGKLLIHNSRHFSCMRSKANSKVIPDEMIVWIRRNQGVRWVVELKTIVLIRHGNTLSLLINAFRRFRIIWWFLFNTHSYVIIKRSQFVCATRYSCLLNGKFAKRFLFITDCYVTRGSRQSAHIVISSQNNTQNSIFPPTGGYIYGCLSTCDRKVLN